MATSSYTYDQVGRLTALTHSPAAGSGTIKYTWGYDADSRVTSMGTPDDTTNSIGYDATSELTGVDYTYQTDESYSYDADGNRTSGGSVTGKGNQLLFDGTYHYHYDAEGNLIWKYSGSWDSNNNRPTSSDNDVTQYTWDFRNRLTAVTHYSSYPSTIDSEVEYTYDYLDRRIRMKIDSNTTGGGESPGCYYDVYQGDNLALEIDDPDGLADNFWANGTVRENDASVSHRYLYGAAVDEILASENASGTVLWGLADNEGTIRDVVNNSGVVQSHRVFDSYGKLTSGTIDNSFAFGYTGQAWDATAKLYDDDHRWYDPSTGDFISKDPANTDVNLYRYCRDNPLNATDPSGLCSESGNYGIINSPNAWYQSQGLPFTSVADQFSWPTEQRSPSASVSIASSFDAGNLYSTAGTGNGYGVNGYGEISIPHDVIYEAETAEALKPVKAAFANAGRFSMGAVRTLGGGFSTVVTGAGALLGVRYCDSSFDDATKLTQLGVSDMGASLGFGGQGLEGVKYGNTASASAQFMSDVRNQPGVSPLVYGISQFTETTSDVSFVLAQGLYGTKLGSLDLAGAWSGPTPVNVLEGSNFLNSTGVRAST